MLGRLCHHQAADSNPPSARDKTVPGDALPPSECLGVDACATGVAARPATARGEVLRGTLHGRPQLLCPAGQNCLGRACEIGRAAGRPATSARRANPAGEKSGDMLNILGAGNGGARRRPNLPWSARRGGNGKTWHADGLVGRGSRLFSQAPQTRRGRCAARSAGQKFQIRKGSSLSASVCTQNGRQSGFFRNVWGPLAAEATAAERQRAGCGVRFAAPLHPGSPQQLVGGCFFFCEMMPAFNPPWSLITFYFKGRQPQKPIGKQKPRLAPFGPHLLTRSLSHHTEPGTTAAWASGYSR